MKKRIICAIVAAITLFSQVSVLAAVPAGFTGWDHSVGTPRYYLGGVLTVNNWVKLGNTFYYMNESGVATPNFVVNEDGLATSSITAYVDSNTASVVTNVPKAPSSEYAAVKEIIGVSTDYEAYKKRFPQVVAAYGSNEAKIYEAYVNSYEGAPLGNKYMDMYYSYLYSIYNAHRYDHHYENMYNGTHKAYCECGAWEIQNCNRDIEKKPGGPYLCNACYAEFDYGKDKPHHQH